MARQRAAMIRAVIVLLVSFVLGAATSWAQGFLPDELRSFANSPSGWTILTAACVVLARPTIVCGALLGAASFVILVLGYTSASHLRGPSYDPVFSGSVGLIAGPAVGALAAALRSSRPRLAAVLLVDAGFGPTVVADTTSPVYWTLVATLGMVLLLVVAIRILRPAPESGHLVLLQVGTTLTAITAGAAGYHVLNSIAA